MDLLAGRTGCPELPRGALDASLDGVEGETGLLDALAGARGEVQVRVESCVPSGKESALDLGVLREAGLAYALHGEGIFLEGRGQGILARTGVLLVQGLAAGQTGAGDGVGEGLRLGLGGGRSRQGSLRFGGRCGR